MSPGDASARPHVLVLVAANGLGHMRRVAGILGCLLERGGDVRLTIAAEPWQQDAAVRWDAGRRLEAHGVAWRPGIVAPGVGWSVTPERYVDGSLMSWEDRLDDLPELMTADVVLSDNLTGVLTRRPDALLAGSFLWSDVLDAATGDEPAVRAFVEHERSLLAEHRPEMLCVADLAMPGVVARTRPHAVGWMCPRAAILPAAPGPPAGTRVAVLGGGTGAADDLLVELADALALDGVDVTVGDALSPRTGAPVFDGSAAAWSSLTVVVARPGVGTLTDCVRSGVPIVCVHEGDNIELAHNASRVAALGFGADLGAMPSPDAVIDAVRRVAAPDEWAAVRQRMAAAARDGLSQGADWLAVHCRLSLLRPWSDQGETT
jgi:hypothetical protein